MCEAEEQGESLACQGTSLELLEGRECAGEGYEAWMRWETDKQAGARSKDIVCHAVMLGFYCDGIYQVIGTDPE